MRDFMKRKVGKSMILDLFLTKGQTPVYISLYVQRKRENKKRDLNPIIVRGLVLPVSSSTHSILPKTPKKAPFFSH